MSLVFGNLVAGGFTVKRIRTHRRGRTHIDPTSDQLLRINLSLMLTEENR